ncbi:Uncharacterised protein [Bordetella pertussis]|nr:Uncharacterised protein [Bordetella pertussis]
MRLRQHPGQRSSRCFDMALLALFEIFKILRNRHATSQSG